MLQRVRRFAIRLHEDESGPNTVEWVLLIIVALLVLVGIWAFVKFVLGRLKTDTETINEMQPEA